MKSNAPLPPADLATFSRLLSDYVVLLGGFLARVERIHAVGTESSFEQDLYADACRDACGLDAHHARISRFLSGATEGRCGLAVLAEVLRYFDRFSRGPVDFVSTFPNAHEAIVFTTTGIVNDWRRVVPPDDLQRLGAAALAPAIEMAAEELWPFAALDFGRVEALARLELAAAMAPAARSEKWYPADHFKTLFGLRPDTLKAAYKRGAIRAERKGGRWYYPELDVLEYWPEFADDTAPLPDPDRRSDETVRNPKKPR